MKIATWNVNSIRTRLEAVTGWLSNTPVDVLCVQETKVTDEEFPRSPFGELGYTCYISGQKSYNGVALLSQQPLDAVQVGFGPVLGEAIGSAFDEQKRVIAGCLGDLCVVNLYVPNGSSVSSDKYTYKLNWLTVLREYLRVLAEQHPKLLVCGDFNIAPEDRDIYDPKGRDQEVMATAAERNALNAVLQVGLADAFRKFHPEAGYFSWWDYRAAAFQRNWGWRIDHHYLSPDLYAAATGCTIDTRPRSLDKPSDHAPVIVEF